MSMQRRKGKTTPAIALRRSKAEASHLAEIREEERAVEAVAAAAQRFRTEARAAMGVVGSSDTVALRYGVTQSGVGWYPLVALSLLATFDQAQANAIQVLGPDIAGGLGIGRGLLVSVNLLRTLMVSVAIFGIAALVQHRPRRAIITVASALGLTMFTFFTGFVTSIWGLMVVMCAAGIATASVQALHQPLLVDTYPPQIRVRALSFYRAVHDAGLIAGPLLVALSTAVGLTWRGVFLVLGAFCLIMSLAGLRLRDPGFGKWDTEKVRDLVRQDVGTGHGELSEEEVKLKFSEVTHRLLMIPTIRRVLVGQVVLGMMLVPFLTYLAFFLRERWGMGAEARSLLLATFPAFSAVSLAIFGPRAEALYRRDPARLTALAGTMLSVAVAFIAAAIMAPVFGLMVLLFGTGVAMVAALGPANGMIMFSIIPAHMRPHMAALSGIAVAAVGGTAGLILLGGVDQRFGSGGAIVALAIPGIVGGLLLRSAGRTVNSDLDQMLDEVIEEEEVRGLAAQGSRLPMLACRNIDFSYGQLQVLFGVNFTVDEGEIVALLGTNGAGKSTLLRVISGLSLPSAGSVRFKGREITYLDAERRLKFGITNIPGGRVVFGPMTVVENLRAFGYHHGRNRAIIEKRIEESLDAFPRLAERRNQPAATLSGGEQQMLGLCRAIMLKPRLLVVDELSLGLAPKIVAELLEMVRRINAAGTAVVLVEQSVNIALRLVQHAYFMEKGEIKFDGAAADLLNRNDLLRSVFLEGAAKASALSANRHRVKAGSSEVRRGS